MEDGKFVAGSVYIYAPNKVAPPVLSFLFFVSMVLHIWQCSHYKCWRVTGYLPWAALLFAVGFIVREVGAFNIGNVSLYIGSLFLIYIAPPVYEFSNYLVLSRALYYVPKQSPIHPGRVTTTYGTISFVVEVLNAIGAVYATNPKLSQRLQDVGKSFIRASLILQIFVLVSFVALAFHFQIRCRKAGCLTKNLRTVLLTLYCSSALIGIRTIYRTVEYFSVSDIHSAPGLDPNTFSPILRYEWFFWVFETTVMAINTILLNAFHPMKYLPQSKTIHLIEDGTEIDGPAFEEERTTWKTFMDPFNLAAKMQKKESN